MYCAEAAELIEIPIGGGDNSCGLWVQKPCNDKLYSPQMVVTIYKYTIENNLSKKRDGVLCMYYGCIRWGQDRTVGDAAFFQITLETCCCCCCCYTVSIYLHACHIEV